MKLLLSTLLSFGTAFVHTPLRINRGSFRERAFCPNSRVRLFAEVEDSITVPPTGLCTGEVTLPGSKSLSNRVLLLAALSEGDTEVHNLLASDDISYMLGALETLGIEVVQNAENGAYTVKGNAGPLLNTDSGPEAPLDIFLGNAGTAMRPLAAALCFGSGSFLLDGVPRMRERPIADLIDGLQQLGADVSCSDTGCPPVKVNAKSVKGGTARISGSVSSQFLSALLMAAPLATSGDVTLEITDELISLPYVLLTIGLMEKFGVKVNASPDNRQFTIPGGQSYKSPGMFFVEGDASSASYFLAAGAISGGPVTVIGCGADSVQGDVAFANVLEQMGANVQWDANSITVSRDKGVALNGVDVDCGEIPDAAMTLAPVALFAEGVTTIRNVYSWRVKETERMKAIVAELTKLGVEVEEGHDFLVIQPPSSTSGGQPDVKPSVAIDTYDDHRMAMCFSLVACAGVPVVIKDPKCTAKTFPDYFEKLSSIATDH